MNGKYIEEIIEKLFNYSYYAYLSFLRDNSMIKFKYLNYYIDNILKNIINFSVNKSNYNHKITQLEELKIKYYKEKGSLISRYFKNKDNKLELDNILNEYSSFVFSDKFKEQYNYLLNQRKNSIECISKKIHERYGFDFFNILKDKIKGNIETLNMDKYDVLELEFIELEKISDDLAFAIIKKSISSDKFGVFIDLYKNKGYIDYHIRTQKTLKNLTLYNPYTKTSKIIMNFHENIYGVMRLVHELMHAYAYELFKDRLTIKNLYEIPKFFWEIFAKIGELFISDYEQKISIFFRKSFYQYVFSYIDYHVLSLKKDYIKIEDILDIKDNLLEFLGINSNLLEFTRYNFIDYNMLYSEHFYAYDSVFSDAIAYGIYSQSKKLNYNFDQILSKVLEIKNINLNSLMDVFKLNYEDVFAQYTLELNDFLQKNFLGDLKYEYYKKK